MASNWRITNWKYVTSEDTTGSLFLSFSSGTIVLGNAVTNTQMRVGYKCLSGGLSKGLPFGLSNSTFDNESSGSYVYSLGYFDETIFPCGGFIVSLGGTMGVLDSNEGPPDPAFSNGASGSIVLFETFPFARLSCYGALAATTPGIGVSVGYARFSLG